MSTAGPARGPRLITHFRPLPPLPYPVPQGSAYHRLLTDAHGRTRPRSARLPWRASAPWGPPAVGELVSSRKPRPAALWTGTPVPRHTATAQTCPHCIPFYTAVGGARQDTDVGVGTRTWGDSLHEPPDARMSRARGMELRRQAQRRWPECGSGPGCGGRPPGSGWREEPRGENPGTTSSAIPALDWGSGPSVTLQNVPEKEEGAPLCSTDSPRRRLQCVD